MIASQLKQPLITLTIFYRSEFSEDESLSAGILGTSGFDDDTESYEDESSLSYTETSFQPDSVRIKLVNLKSITN